MRIWYALLVEGALLFLLIFFLPWALYPSIYFNEMPTIVIDNLTESIEEKNETIPGKSILFFEENFSEIDESPFYIDGLFWMNESAETQLFFHVKRDGVTNFEIILNQKKIDGIITLDEKVYVTLQKKYVRKGQNVLNITLQDEINFDVYYSSFEQSPLTIFSDTSIISDQLLSARFFSLTSTERSLPINCDASVNLDNCFIAKAIHEKDISICDSESSDHNRFACRLQVAKALDIPEICSEISSINARTSCYIELAIALQNNEYCQLAMRNNNCWAIS